MGRTGRRGGYNGPVLTRYTLLAACFALAALIGSTVACQSQERPPNVVVILTDTLRANYLGVYGYPKETAPFLADLPPGSSGGPSSQSACYQQLSATSRVPHAASSGGYRSGRPGGLRSR